MAIVQTLVTLVPELTPWVSPGTLSGYQGAAPVGQVIVDDTATIAAKGAPDESQVTLSLTLPKGWVYRTRYMAIQAISNGDGTFDDFEKGIAYQVSENEVTKYYFALYNTAPTVHLTSGSGSFQAEPTTITNDRAAYFTPWDLSNINSFVIDASQGSSLVYGQWMDVTTDTTAATTIRIRYEFDYFSVEQYRSFPMNTSTPVYQ